MLNMWQKMAKDTAPKCDNAINIVLNHCVARNLFLNCPAKETSKTCEDMFQFAKTCRKFPMPTKKYLGEETV